ncbi:acylphosphatase [Phenylobacterium soli]|uniref:acylphosphatase n=1 Tax=Phenylobacterium soli TaxID=2170551 RepID=A0A328AGL1_9CAUL|nr:acylphosphatase [Phenylobacterium soli]RAK53657.1 acylphosphatase [Phenylobacterium soli]
MRIAVRLEIEGRVQGVGYRWWTVRQARALGLAGWVRNRADGSVEALVVGAPEAVEALVAACATGPAAAEVRAIRRHAAQDEGHDGFEERATL